LVSVGYMQLEARQKFPQAAATAQPPCDLNMSHPSSQEHQGVQLYVGVISFSGNRAKRDAVRSTWGSDQRLARVVFVVSRPATMEALDSIRQEAKETGDIILVHHVEEHYFSITHQSLEVFRSAHAFHGPITHVMKCDDDSYVHVSRMLEFLGSQPFQFSWAGNIVTSYQPHRDPSSKWYVSKKDWPDDTSAIRWSNGPGYVLSTDLVRLLATGAVSKCAPGPLFKLEDVAVGSWLTCLEKEQNISIHLATGGRFNIASCAAGDLLSHYVSPSQMRCMIAQEGNCCQDQQVL
jgi:beta-1,3-galactosyltransferase